MELEKYTPSIYKSMTTDVLYVGVGDENVKFFKLKKQYKNPKFIPRPSIKWSDTFDIQVVEDNTLRIQRTDANLGWGALLIIDVQFELDSISAPELLEEQKIPRVIHQTFSTSNVPCGMYKAVNSWKTLNSDYEYYFYTDEDCIAFIKKYFDKKVLYAYLNLIPGAFKADLFRCCVLYEKGGVYVDADMICLNSLRDLIEPLDSFVISRDDPMAKSFLYNAFIASEPKHPFLKQQIEAIVDNVTNLKDLYYLEISGPCLLGKVVNKLCGRDSNESYELGNQTLGDFTLKILEHDFKNKCIKYNNLNLLMTEYSEKNEEMLELKIPTYYSLFEEGKIYQQIPRNIVSTSEDRLGINTYMVDSFVDKNKYWDFKNYVSSDRLAFLTENREEFFKLLGFDVVELYNSFEKNVERADFFRYCIIYLNGGLYSDSDTFCNVELDKWINSYDLILGTEMYSEPEFVSSFGGDNIGQNVDGMILCICNYAFAAKPKHEFLKNIILDIYNNPIPGNILLNTATGRMSKHAYNYFYGSDFSKIREEDLIKKDSILLSINRFGSNQQHSKAYKNYENPRKVEIDGVYIVHMFEGSWWSVNNKSINIFKSQLGISHNLAIDKTPTGYIGVARLDKDVDRTLFMKQIGDCRSLVEYTFDSDLNLTLEEEKAITGYDRVAKFEDYRFFTFNNKRYCSVSYIDLEFNTRVGILDENYNFLGDVNIDTYNLVTWSGEERVWEKNWLFFEKEDELYFIYSTMPNYILYKCTDFEKLRFEKVIDLKWPLADTIPSKEFYFTGDMGSTKKVAVGGSTNPIFIENKNLYLYFVHTKMYTERSYNHYAVLLNQDLMPVKLLSEPTIKKYVPFGLMFLSSVIETEDYLVFTGGVEDSSNFVWELSKNHLFKLLGI